MPRPRRRAAATAARSVTRTISSVRIRSSTSCDGTEFCVGIVSTPSGSVEAPASARNPRSVLLDSYNLRAARDDLVSPHCMERAMHRILVGGIGDQEHRNRRSRRVGFLVIQLAVGMTLDDRFD